MTLRIDDIIWLSDTAEKLERKHGVLPHEVEEALIGSPQFRRLERGNVPGEDLFVALGRSTSGRYLAVFFIYKSTREALVISAREMTRRERRIHDDR